MHGGPPDPGRGVYLARRIVAVIVVLILLVKPFSICQMFDSRIFQALLSF
jgi:hypothetical protein